MLQIPSFVQSMGSLLDEIPGAYVPQEDLENTIAELATSTVTIAAVSLIILTILAMLLSNRFEKLKMPLFVLMVVAMAGSSVTLVGSTVYLNTKADSGGPVHWHADAEFWACGNELELRDPTGFLSNKIGTATLHEHDDHRIHLEGVVVDEEIDATLGKFMHVSGGAITEQELVMPLNADGEGNLFEDDEDGDGPASTDPAAIEPYIIDDPEIGKVAHFKDGDTCNDEVSDVQVFVYKYDGENKTYVQTKLENPRDYVISGEPNVPPGDCVIFEFGPSRDKTDKLCEQYGIRDIDRCSQFGVTEAQREICELTQVNFSSSDTEANDDTSAEVVEGEESTEVLEGDGAEELVIAEDAVQSDPATEQARKDCEAEVGNDGPACTKYNALLKDNPGAQAEADSQNGLTTNNQPAEQEAN